MKILLVPAVVSLAITLLNSSVQAQNEYHVNKVVIDAGHGGKDSGALGKNLKEKDITLQIALKVGGYIEQYLPDVKVIYTRKTDVFVELDDRAEIANKNNANVFISIHVNASPSSSVYGTETWVMGLDKRERNLDVAKRENSVITYDENYKEQLAEFDPNNPESMIMFDLRQEGVEQSSLDLAAKVQDQFLNRAGRRSHGVKQGPFWVLWKTTMPSILVETGFITNDKEERELGDAKTQDYIASAIFRAFRDYKEEVENTTIPSTKVNVK